MARRDERLDTVGSRKRVLTNVWGMLLFSSSIENNSVKTRPALQQLEKLMGKLRRSQEKEEKEDGVVVP